MFWQEECANCVFLLSKYRFKIRNILLHNRQDITFQWDIFAGIKNGTLNILCLQSINGRLDRTRMVRMRFIEEFGVITPRALSK
jgi:hypothetical protein